MGDYKVGIKKAIQIYNNISIENSEKLISGHSSKSAGVQK